MNSLRRFDLEHIAGCERLVGVDEAGRGCLAGPVVAGAVCLQHQFLQSSWCEMRADAVDDSKKLDEPQREFIFEEIQNLKKSGKLHAETGLASVAEINAYNILGATRLAMRRALEAIIKTAQTDLSLPLKSANNPLFEKTSREDRIFSLILIDGKPLRPFPYAHKAIVKGDGKSLAIALASILAKVTRDEIMREMELTYPGYGFARNKGYGTSEHRSAILRVGRTAEHRPFFLRNIFAHESTPEQTGLPLEAVNLD